MDKTLRDLILECRIDPFESRIRSIRKRQRKCSNQKEIKVEIGRPIGRLNLDSIGVNSERIQFTFPKLVLSIPMRVGFSIIVFVVFVRTFCCGPLDVLSPDLATSMIGTPG